MAPISSKASVKAYKWPVFISFISNFLFNITAAIINVPATILSLIILWLALSNLLTPSIWIIPLVLILIFAPILFKQSAKSDISGSIAAFSIIVLPFAIADAIIIFSVAPTLGNDKGTWFPIKPFFTLPITYPFSTEKLAPNFFNPSKWISIGLVPMAQPPGREIFASPNLLIKGPKIKIEALIFLTMS